MKPPLIGTRIDHEELPDAQHSAAALGNTGVEVVATPVLIGFLEQTCHLLLEPYYEAGERTVGVNVSVDHLAPAVLGTPVMLSAELTEIDGRRLTFSVGAAQEGRAIMRGSHTRAVVKLDRFAKATPKAEAKERQAEAPACEFWFGVNSPWCFLAAERIGAIARRHGAALTWRPVHLAKLNEWIGGRRPLEENERFVRWYRQDLQDWAALQDLEIRYHPGFPLRPSRALRACLFAADQGRAEAFVRRLLRAYWCEGADISDLGTLEAIGQEAGFDGGQVGAAVTERQYKDRLNANLEEAVERGLFGLPSVIAGGKIFFGNDRLDLLDRALGQARAGIADSPTDPA